MSQFGGWGSNTPGLAKPIPVKRDDVLRGEISFDEKVFTVTIRGRWLTRRERYRKTIADRFTRRTKR